MPSRSIKVAFLFATSLLLAAGSWTAIAQPSDPSAPNKKSPAKKPPKEKPSEKSQPKKADDPNKMSAEELIERGDELRKGTTARERGMAVAYFKAAMNKGSGDGATRYAMMTYSGESGRPNPTGALEILVNAADKLNHAEAAEWVGKFYLSGECKDPQRADGFGAQNYEKAFRYLSLAVERGRTQAKEPLARMYMERRGVEWDYVKALALLQDVDASGGLSAEGQCRIGDMFRDGIGTPKDRQQAAKYYQKAADSGFLLGSTRLGQLYLRFDTPPNVSAATPHFAKASAGEEPEGMTELAILNIKASGVERDLHGAIELLDRASKKGFGGAMHAMAGVYFNGIDVPSNTATAIEWLERAAKAGWPESMICLGGFYESRGTSNARRAAANMYQKAASLGHPVGMSLWADVLWEGSSYKANPKEAAVWCGRAAERGYAPAMNRMGLAARTGDGVAENYSVAMEWFRKAADAGSVDAIFYIGSLHDQGQGVKADGAAALQWYTRAAEAGHSTAMVLIASMHMEGRGVPKDVQQGIEWLRKGANDKSAAPAMRELAKLLLEGKDIAKDEAEAMKWLEKAGAAGDGPAMFMLGSAYFNGDRVGKDLKTAEDWFEKAERAGEGRAALALGILIAAKVDIEMLRLGDSQTQRDVERAAASFRRAARRGYSTPEEYRGILTTADAIAEAEERKTASNNLGLSPLPGAEGGWKLVNGQFGNRGAADAAYDAGAGERDFRAQTAGYLGSQGLSWR